MKISASSLSAIVCIVILTGCGNQGTNKGKLSSVGFLSKLPENSAVNSIEQAKPEIMVIPSDNILQTYEALNVVLINGAEFLERDYQAYFLADNNNKAAVSVIQDEFSQQGYPLTDLEQTLKSIGNREAVDAADNLEKDAKTLLLQKASPDIFIELDYHLSMDNTDPNLNKQLTYTLTAFDAYTNKSICSKTVSGVIGRDFKEMLTSSIHKNIKGITDGIKDYFTDIMLEGREITVRFSVEKGSNVLLGSECATGDSYSDWIMDYMDLNTKKGTYKLQNNTDYELYFTNVRIPVLREDGTQFSAYHWARQCTSAIRNDCGIKASNKVQGLGEVNIVIKGF